MPPKRILAWPRNLRLNPMPGSIHDDLERHFGWRVARFDYWRGVASRYAILHVSFPHEAFRNRSKAISLVRAVLHLTVLRLAKARHRRLVWTVHNLTDHESHHPQLESAFMDRYTGMADLVIHMSEVGRDAAVARYPRLAAKPAAIIPHPYYRTAGNDAPTREAALKALGLPPDCKLLLAFGVVRRYKNLLTLVRAFSDLPGSDIRLVVAGVPVDVALAQAIRDVATDSRIKLILRKIAEGEIASLFAAATLVVAPYFDILNSGAAVLSLTHRRPVLVPRRGAMPELQKNIGPDWVRLFDAPLTPLELGNAVHWANEPRDDAPDLNRFAPEKAAAAYDAALSRLIERAP
jgi:glycosyltransferase involved in cell wall biosynthesis